MSQRSLFSLAAKLVVVLGLIALAGYFYWANSHLLVKSEPVRKGKAVDAVTGSVTIFAEFPTTVRSGVAGRVTRSTLDIGSPVKMNDFLVQLDAVDLELDIEATEDNLEIAKKRVQIGSVTTIELENARVDLANAERSASMGTYSTMDLERVRRNVRAIEQRQALENLSNEATIAALENGLAVRRRQLEKMTVRSPVDGVVTEVFSRQGDLIGSESPIASLISNSRRIEARISEENFAGIRVDQKASVRFLGYGDEQFSAKVAKILPTADPATQRYIVLLEVVIAPERLVPGLTGEVSIVVGERTDTLIFPRRALLGNKVFVLKNGRVELRPVRTGFVSLNEVEALEGLTEGEQVLVENLEQVRPGDRVRIPTQPR